MCVSSSRNTWLIKNKIAVNFKMFLECVKCVQANLYTLVNRGFCKGIQICLYTLYAAFTMIMFYLILEILKNYQIQGINAILRITSTHWCKEEWVFPWRTWEGHNPPYIWRWGDWSIWLWWGQWGWRWWRCRVVHRGILWFLWKNFARPVHYA